MSVESTEHNPFQDQVENFLGLPCATWIKRSFKDDLQKMDYCPFPDSHGAYDYNCATIFKALNWKDREKDERVAISHHFFFNYIFPNCKGPNYIFYKSKYQKTVFKKVDILDELYFKSEFGKEHRNNTGHSICFHHKTPSITFDVETKNVVVSYWAVAPFPIYIETGRVDCIIKDSGDVSIKVPEFTVWRSGQKKSSQISMKSVSQIDDTDLKF